VNEIVFPFIPTMNTWAMGTTTQGHVVHLRLRKPFEDRAMATKSLREIMVEKENLDLHHVSIIYNKLSAFIAQAI
jgi:hypothetical protein